MRAKALKKNGFEGDVMDKMYKSARYYHRKKLNKISNQTQDQDQDQDLQIKKTIYIRLTDILHTNMNNHVAMFITKHITKNTKLQEPIPVTYIQSFQDFLENNRETIIHELVKIKRTKGSLEENMGDKLQRNYRDKFYKQRLNIMNNIHL